jgi:hypothetical protein
VLSERFVNGFFLTGTIVFGLGGMAVIHRAPVEGISGLAFSALMGVYYYRIKNHESFDLSAPIDARFIDRCCRAVESRVRRKPRTKRPAASSTITPQEASQRLHQLHANNRRVDIRATRCYRAMGVGFLLFCLLVYKYYGFNVAPVTYILLPLIPSLLQYGFIKKRRKMLLQGQQTLIENRDKLVVSDRVVLLLDVSMSRIDYTSGQAGRELISLLQDQDQVFSLTSEQQLRVAREIRAEEALEMVLDFTDEPEERLYRSDILCALTGRLPDLLAGQQLINAWAGLASAVGQAPSSKHSQQLSAATAEMHSIVAERINASLIGAEMLRPATSASASPELLRSSQPTTDEAVLLRSTSGTGTQ